MVAAFEARADKLYTPIQPEAAREQVVGDPAVGWRG